MKVLMTADPVGGVWSYALELAAALEGRGVSIVIATMGAPLRSSQWAEVAARRNVTIHEGRYKLEWMNDPWDDVDRAGAWLLELERIERPDVVQLNGFVHGALPWRSPVIVVGHSCVRSWWEAVRRETPPRQWDEYTRRVTDGLHSADAVIAPSHAMRDALRRHYGPLDRVKVVHNGRAGTFRSGEKAPFVMSVGRLWDEGKNVAALARVADELPWPVYVAGSTTAPDGPRAGTLGHLQPLGVLPPPELADWLSHASIYALPARYEPFGLSVLEAARSGCALVLGDIESLRELWGDAAMYVDPNDDEQLLSAIERLAADLPARRALAARALCRARSFTPERMATEYLAVYEGVQRAGSARARETICVS